MSTAQEQMAIPPVWRTLIHAINGENDPRIPDGAPGVRDVDAPCEAFEPAGKPYQIANGSGDCMTDGHNLCVECVHIAQETLREKRDLCIECGEAMVTSKALGRVCSDQCAESVPRW